MINRMKRGKFGALSGLRQGDALAPLFTLIVDILSRIVSYKGMCGDCSLRRPFCQV